MPKILTRLFWFLLIIFMFVLIGGCNSSNNIEQIQNSEQSQNNIENNGNFDTNSKTSETVNNNINIIETTYGQSIEVVNGIIKDAYGINPNIMGDKAVIMSQNGKDMALIDVTGKTIDDLNDLEAYMNNIKIEKSMIGDSVPLDYLIAGHLYSENLLLFASNYDSKTAYLSLWYMDLDTRKINKVLDSEEYGNISFIYVGDNKMLLYSSLKKTVIEMESLDIVKEHTINGHIISTSNDGNIIVYQVYDEIMNLHNYIGFYNISTNSIIELEDEIGENRFYNTGGVWNESGSAFAFVAHSYNSGERQLLIYNFDSDNLIEFKDNNIKYSIKDDSIEFIENNVIEIKLINNESVKYTLSE